MVLWRWCALWLSLAACGGQPDDDDSRVPPPDELQLALDDTVSRLAVPGAVLAVSSPELGERIVASGFANPQTEQPMLSTDLFGIGSITKTFTAAVILQLREEGSRC